MEIKNKIIEKGYRIISEENDIITFVNENVNYCCILIKKYDEKDYETMDKLYEYYEKLKKEYDFADKGTILLINDIVNEREIIERNVYNSLKTYIDNIDVLPSTKNKLITITFKSIESPDDACDYCINPYEEFDGIAVKKYLIFLNRVTKDSIVLYPKIFEPHYLRYVANKIYTIKLIK